MAQKTSLSAFALPGAVRTFTPKTPDAGGGPHPVDQITALSAGSWPGGVHTFTPKTPDIDGGPHPVGRLTALMAFGVPGRTRSFEAKRAPVIPPPARRQFYKLEGSSRTKFRRYFIVEED